MSAFTFVYALICFFIGCELFPITFESFQIVWLFILILPFLNIYAIIINPDSDNKYYWVALIFNMLTIVFIMKMYHIDLL